MKLDRAATFHFDGLVPSDKSITHRAFLLAGLARGESFIRRPLRSADTLATLAIVGQLGARVEDTGEGVRMWGSGRWTEPDTPLDCKNAGTAARLLLGALAPAGLFAVLVGDASLSARPMNRVRQPLARAGARIEGRHGGEHLPLAVLPAQLHGQRHVLQVPSAQVKSALLLAGMQVNGDTSVVEPWRSRDHTERMLAHLGARLTESDDAGAHEVAVRGPFEVPPLEDLTVPGDPSSAAFLAAAACMVPKGQATFRQVGVNPTRTGFFDLLEQMGAEVLLGQQKTVYGEPVADVTVRCEDPLRPFTVTGQQVPGMIDELPLAAALACLAEGESRIEGAAELRVKESDRIAAMTEGLRRMGADVTATPDGFVIRGGRPLHGASVRGFGDHRVVMSLAIAALAAEGSTSIEGAEAVDVSFPEFFPMLVRAAR